MPKKPRTEAIEDESDEELAASAAAAAADFAAAEQAAIEAAKEPAEINRRAKELLRSFIRDFTLCYQIVGFLNSRTGDLTVGTWYFPFLPTFFVCAFRLFVCNLFELTVRADCLS